MLLKYLLQKSKKIYSASQTARTMESKVRHWSQTQIDLSWNLIEPNHPTSVWLIIISLVIIKDRIKGP